MKRKRKLTPYYYYWDRRPCSRPLPALLLLLPLPLPRPVRGVAPPGTPPTPSRCEPPRGRGTWAFRGDDVEIGGLHRGNLPLGSPRDRPQGSTPSRFYPSINHSHSTSPRVNQQRSKILSDDTQQISRMINPWINLSSTTLFEAENFSRAPDSVPGVRRGRGSFDGHRQIANKENRCGGTELFKLSRAKHKHAASQPPTL
jgi:hypothetical protein